jgi:protein-tyrosine-phosphatase
MSTVQRKGNIVNRVSIKNRDRLQNFLRAALVVAATSATTMAAAEVSPETPKTIVFVCLHGSVKSQMAAAHFNQIAKERGLPFTAISRGIAPAASIPPRIRDGLALDGLTPLNDAGVSMTVEEALSASKVVAFDDVPADRRATADVTYWSDVPLDIKDYAGTRDAIVRHLDTLMPSLVTK